MIAVIENIDATKFRFNGVPYFKNFFSQVADTKVRIMNQYDSSFELLPYTEFNEITVDGAGFGSATDLQEALLPVLYTRSSLSGVVVNGNLTSVTFAGNVMTFGLQDGSTVNVDLSPLDQGTALSNHISDNSNPHNTDASSIGLGNVDNTSDIGKPISTAVSNALDNKSDKGSQRVNVNSAGLTVGQAVFGRKAGINGGEEFEGYVLVTPPTTDAHIEFTYKVLM